MVDVNDVGPLDWRVSIVDKSGRPSPEFQRRWNSNRNNTALIPAAGDPTGVASDVANNGTANTYMRSDATPAVQKGSSGQFGIVKVDGTTLSSASGIVSAKTATTSTLGIVKPDNSTTTVSGGTLSVPTATTSNLGLVKPDGSTITISGGVISSVGGSSGGAGGGFPVVNAPLPSSFPNTLGSPVGMTAVTNLGFILDAGAFGNGDRINGYTQAPPTSTPYTITLGISAAPKPQQYSLQGIAFSDGTKILTFGHGGQLSSGSPPALKVDHWSNSTTFSSESYAKYADRAELFRVKNDGTNFTFYTSMDGYAWTPIYQESVTAFLSAITQIGFFFSPNDGGSGPSGEGQATIFYWYTGSGPTPPPPTPGSGTVTSVGVSVPSIMTVTGSPVTSSGTVAITLATETANQVFAGPVSGGASVPTFRNLVAADIPTISYTQVSGLGTIATQNSNSVSITGGTVNINSSASYSVGGTSLLGFGGGSITSNIAIGSSVLGVNTSGTNLIGIGASALANTTSGGPNTAIGAFSMNGNVSGSGNVAIGSGSMLKLPSSTGNTAIGAATLFNATSGDENVVIGANAMQNANGASNNIAIGTSSLNNATGSNNTAIGFQALLSLTSGTNNIVIGASQDVVSSTANGQINIGGLFFGTGAVGSVGVPKGNAGIATTSPRVTLDVAGPIATNVVAFSTLPSASSCPGARAMINNSNLSAASNFGAIITGSGSNIAPVYSDGTNWRIG